mmetsp:Transcript_17669/g.35523  ORF Transcript_17669/g.35523 Transcript_17669/m.35523 type:complete len:575 (-) Transcript_17669:263-1987(-)
MRPSHVDSLCLLLVAGHAQSFVFLAATKPSSSSFLYRGRPTLLTTASNNDDNQDDELTNFYDDFAELDTSEASFLAQEVTPVVPSALQERMQQVQQAEAQDQDRVRNNWDQANWQVRGFSLDTIDARKEQHQGDDGDGEAPIFSSAPPIHVTTLTAPSTTSDVDDDERSVWVGRTDGSLILVRLGSEFVARFESKLSLESSDDPENLSVSVQSKLVRDSRQPNNDDKTSMDDPFEILCQRQAYDNEPIQHVVATSYMVYTVAEGSSDIQPWLIPETTTTSDETFGLVAQPALTGVHKAPLVGLHAVSMVPSSEDDSAVSEPTLLTSVSVDGVLAVWDISTGALLFTCHLMNNEDEQGSVITSATAAHGHWFLGRSDGKIIGYPMATLVQATADGGPCPLPAAEWAANPEQTAITALHIWGPATVRNTPSLVVVSGDDSGLVQQWDILERRSSSSSHDGEATVLLDAWPKMARQRLSERAHLLQGHEGAITCITSTPHAVVTSSRDGTVRAFDPATGSITTRMDGFVEGQLANLCLVGHQDLLLTDGNGPHVTVHDFFSASEDILKDVDLDWDNY